jgi:hypothetical protein
MAVAADAAMAVAAATAVAAEVVAGMEAALAGMEAADAEASALGAAAAGAAGAAEAAADPAGYGHHSAWSTAAGVSLHLRQRYLMSRWSHPHRQRRLRGRGDLVTANLPQPRV